MPKSQMRSVMRRSELAHERQKTNLAEPLVSKSWLRCTDKNFADFAKNGVFQHNPPMVSNDVNGPDQPLIAHPVAAVQLHQTSHSCIAQRFD
jgi:hypothetical protein